MNKRPRKKLADVQAWLDQKIRSGEWAVGAELPIDSELATGLGCSIGTISKALVLLAHDGVVERKPKAGTVLLKRIGTPRPTSLQLDAYALLYPSERHEAVREMVHGFEDAARQRGRRLVMMPTGLDFQRDAEILSRLDEFDVRGVAACPVISNAKEQLQACQLLLSSPIPVVLMGMSLPGFSSAAVLLDNFEAGYTMTRYLLNKGHRKIGFLSNYAWIQFRLDRYLGYRWAMEEMGCKIDPTWVHLDQAMNPDIDDPTRESRGIAYTYLNSRPGVEAVVCGDDFMAVGLLTAASELGYRVPDDLKITGIEDFSIAAEAHPPLTSYHVPYAEIGTRAFGALDALVAREAPGRGGDIHVRGKIIERASA